MATPLPDAEGADHHVHHRNVQGGAARAAVFGASDGLVSNVSLILGVAGADSSQGVVRIAGIAGLIAGAVSMAAGEYVSMKAQRELVERELEIERRELRRNPLQETAELSALYQSRGAEPDAADHLAESVMADPSQALEVHAREELGVDPNQLGNPLFAAGTSLASFSIGAFLPLIPWLITGGNGAVIASVVLGLIGSIAVGVALAIATGRSITRTVLRQVLIAAAAAGATFLIGSALGTDVS